MTFKFSSMRLCARGGLSAIALSALSACAEPTGPEAAARSNLSPATISHSVRAASTATKGIDDIVGRVLPAMSDQLLADEIKSQLQLFASAVDSNDPQAAGNAVARVHQLLATAEIHPANLGALRMVLRVGQARLEPETERQ